MIVRKFDGRVDIASNGGQLRLADVAGPLNATTLAGQINAQLSSAADVKLETSSGAITVTLPENAGFDLDAKSAIGAVTTDFPIAAERKDRDLLIGRINGGGKPLFLRTGAGSIHIKGSGAERASR
jgi:DUF4097 and DUF4098 domain-containing protein YvlB